MTALLTRPLCSTQDIAALLLVCEDYLARDRKTYPEDRPGCTCHTKALVCENLLCRLEGALADCRGLIRDDAEQRLAESHSCSCRPAPFGGVEHTLECRRRQYLEQRELTGRP